MWWKKKTTTTTTRKDLTEDAKEDLDLKDDDADKVAGGLSKKWGATTGSPDKF
jgi:hypothetical protein